MSFQTQFYYKTITDDKPGCEKAVGLFNGSAEEVIFEVFKLQSFKKNSQYKPKTKLSEISYCKLKRLHCRGKSW